MVFVADMVYSFWLVVLWDPFLVLFRRQRRGAASVDWWLLRTRFGRAGDRFGPREMPMLLRGRWAWLGSRRGSSPGGRPRFVVVRERCRTASGACRLVRYLGSRPPFSNNQSLHRANITAARRLRQRFHSACKLRPSLGSRRLAMKLVVALALPAAALRPVTVSMSAAQNRRAFVIGGTAAAAAAATKANAYSLPDLPYAYDALEPSIDAATMKFHHGE